MSNAVHELEDEVTRLQRENVELRVLVERQSRRLEAVKGYADVLLSVIRERGRRDNEDLKRLSEAVAKLSDID